MCRKKKAYTMEELKENSAKYDLNYEMRADFVAQFMQKHGLRYSNKDRDGMTDALIKEGGTTWRDLVKEEKRLWRKGVAIRKYLFPDVFDPCRGLPCEYKCGNPETVCKMLNREKNLSKHYLKKEVDFGTN